MFVRALFILLLALNIGGACWLVFAPRAQPAATAPATDPGVAPLVLLSERDGSRPDPTELAAAPESAADLARDQCRRLGPFPTQAEDPTIKRAANDVGGLVDMSKGWRPSLPDPRETASAAERVAKAQSGEPPAPVIATTTLTDGAR